MFVLLIVGFRLDRLFFSVVKWLIIPLVLSLCYSLSDFNYDAYQSIFYLVMPLMSFSLGYFLSFVYKRIEDFFRIIIYTGFLNSVLFIILGLWHMGRSFLFNSYDFRDIYIWSSIFPFVSILLLLFWDGSSLFKFRKLFILVGSLQLILVQSRTYFLVIFVAYFFFLFKKQKAKVILAFSLFLLVFVILSSVFTESVFLAKISSAPKEAFIISNFENDEEINTYYRAYETIQIISDYINADFITKIFGHKLSSVLSLDTAVKLGEDYRNEIPIFHNGYMYMLYRYGLFGFILYIVFFFSLVSITRTMSSDFVKTLSIVLILSLCISNFFVSSFFSIEFCSLWVILGYVIFSDNNRSILTT